MQNIERHILDLKEAAEKLSIRIETANLNDQEFAIQSGSVNFMAKTLLF